MRRNPECAGGVLDAGALPPLVAAMRAHAGSAFMQHAACGALRNIAIGSAARARLIVSAGALSLVDAVLTTHTVHALLQHWGGTLAQMLRNA